MRVIKLSILFILIILALIACDSGTPTPLPPTITLVPTNTPQPIASNTALPISTPMQLPQTNAESPSEQANIRIVNAGADLPPVTIEIQGLTFASNLAFGATTLPSGIVAGNYEMTISDANETVSHQQLLEIEGGDNLILMLTGTPDALIISTYDDNIDPLASGQSRINLIHAINRGPNITLQESDVDLTLPIEFGETTNAFTIDSRPVTFFFQSGTETLETLPTTLTEQRSYTYIITGDFNEPDSIRLISFDTRVPSISNLRFINALVDIGVVDVYFDNKLVIAGIEPTRFSERQPVGSKGYEVGIYPVGSNPLEDEAIVTQQINITHDNATLILMGNSSDNIQIAYFEDDLTPTSASEMRIRFINAVSDIPAVSVITQSGEPVEGIPSLLTYGQATRNTNLPNDSYTFFWSQISDEESGSFIEVAENLILEAGRSYLYLFTAQDNDTPLIFSENVGVNTIVTASDLDETIAETQPIGPTRMRFIHAIDSAPLINVFIDDLEIGSLLPYRATIDYLIIPAGAHIISIREETNTQIIGAIEFEFEADTDYSIFAYGFEAYGFEIAVFEDNINPQEDRSIIRLVNLSQEDNTELSLRFIEATGSSAQVDTSQPNPASTEELQNQSSTSRPSLFSGTQILTQAIDFGQATIFSSLTSGQVDFIITDYLSRIATIFYNVTIDANKVYELIVYEDIISRDIRGIILEIPQP